LVDLDAADSLHSIDEVPQLYTSLFLCNSKLPPSVQGTVNYDGRLWDVFVFTGKWTDAVSSGGCDPEVEEFEKNQAFEFILDVDSKLTISLSQLYLRENDKQPHCSGVNLYQVCIFSKIN